MITQVDEWQQTHAGCCTKTPGQDLQSKSQHSSRRIAVIGFTGDAAVYLNGRQACLTHAPSDVCCRYLKLLAHGCSKIVCLVLDELAGPLCFLLKLVCSRACSSTGTPCTMSDQKLSQSRPCNRLARSAS